MHILCSVDMTIILSRDITSLMCHWIKCLFMTDNKRERKLTGTIKKTIHSTS